MTDVDQMIEEIFGPQPEGLYASIGQLAALTSLLDDQVLGLLTALLDEPVAPYESNDAYDNIKLCRERANTLPSPLRRQVKEALGRLSSLRGLRNARVHNIWSQWGFGWRRDPNIPAGEPAAIVTHRIDDELMAAVRRAALLVKAMQNLTQQCYSEKAKRRMS